MGVSGTVLYQTHEPSLNHLNKKANDVMEGKSQTFDEKSEEEIKEERRYSGFFFFKDLFMPLLTTGAESQSF